jgi:hypothetical protein
MFIYFINVFLFYFIFNFYLFFSFFLYIYIAFTFTCIVMAITVRNNWLYPVENLLKLESYIKRFKAMMVF